MQTWKDFTGIITAWTPRGGVLTTYNFYTGLLNWRGPTPLPPFGMMNPIQQVLHIMNETTDGLSIFITPPSEHQKHRISLETHFIAERLPNIRFFWTPNNHTKMIAMYFETGHEIFWNSSRNFHESMPGEYHELVTQVTTGEDVTYAKEILKKISQESEPIQEKDNG